MRLEGTGFKYHEIERGYSFSFKNEDNNYIFFLLEGDMQISCNEFSKQIVKKNEFFLIPVAADVVYVTLSSCKLLLFSFDTLPDLFTKLYLQSLIQKSTVIPFVFTPIPINEPLNRFISLMRIYLEKGLSNNELLHEVKSKEFFIVLKSFYPAKDMALLLHPLIGKSIEFRMQVLRNYRKVNTIEEFAELLGLEKRTFTRQFREEFETSPYQWLLGQKAKHIRFSLIETNRSLDSIRKEYGFKFSAHFTRFCQEQFSCPPKKFRKQFAEK